ncbi:acylneuraminate cytidylyltransferase [Edwardsiella ictaluri]|uniref:N-acylneuraminate cytidylyltransferase, putative n=1 Tax=Edwardsiella ictaluri (strain 93-146) TaxID=634503 RepID=C5BCQ9_EDWI9|nr:GDSL-type esterase/lipase family protein [Edwardsiella ictaluri]ACR68514.1 N-acylneuraminate cytidylyltransferase, putative [Edwardsiella ictaluri 93-146]AVZ81164.1 acylneuraminate cytidylyltransferase [Edwardsiella ictaluri]EKS7770558.1 acylneuraminate cytidylyltransferase [Edwardsiella ictaluri]EKS7773700.1 acylneuraminate cytidylyltransferase [Edwardsiella ictaluri]EKS7777068.1 acylneuraminate cytidylyltransferase [Edwardsiella ictaluri]
MKVAIIPARSGSKGLRNKNILMLMDKPLIAYTIEAAINSGVFDRVIVSTDSDEYKRIAESFGAEVFIRDAALASDSATSYMVVEDVLSKVSDIQYFALLQPTSPFRTAEHIKSAAALFYSSEHSFLVSMVQSDKPSYLIKPLAEDLTLKYFDIDFSLYHRQDNKEYFPNGAIFMAKPEAYLKRRHFFGSDSVAFIMSKEDSLDIDDRYDFEVAINIQMRRCKKEILRENIINRIAEKKELMCLNTSITLLGHSIFDYWLVDNINGEEVNNLGIAGINTKEYIDLILDRSLIKNIGDTAIIMLGTNDMVLNDWDITFSAEWVREFIDKVRIIKNNVAIYFIAVPPVRGRVDRNNDIITQLNIILRKVCLDKSIHWIGLSNEFYDEYGNLPASYTYDGLHFSQLAYTKLKENIETALS